AKSMAARHPFPNSVGVLAVREARRGTLIQPNDGYPYLILGLTYDVLTPVGSSLRPLQQLCAFHQALDRLTYEQIESKRLGRVVTTMLQALFKIHVNHGEPGELDLAEEALSRCLDMYDRYPPTTIPETEREPA